jgi:hypothetical protein
VHARVIDICDLALSTSAAELSAIQSTIQKLAGFYRSSKGGMQQRVNATLPSEHGNSLMCSLVTKADKLSRTVSGIVDARQQLAQ